MTHAHGEEGLAFLDEALGDRGMPVELRRNMPRSVSLFAAAPAAAVLARHLMDEPSGAVRYRILRGMNRLAASAEVQFDPVLVRTLERAIVSPGIRLRLEQE